ncbi:MAG: GNAT family N-acetyltransferase [Pyrinomonadaceae bacterium]
MPEVEREKEIVVREVSTLEEYDGCIRLQREAFEMPEIEISPRRHFIVTHLAGGWTLGAFAGDEMMGFVHHLIALRGADEIIGYSHMMAVAREYQNRGVGAHLKWAQRERALSEGRTFIRWTWDPMQARNAHFNLNRLGVVVRSYAVNFYGTDSSTPNEATGARIGLDSDRLFAEWELDSGRVKSFAAGSAHAPQSAPVATIEIPPNWNALVQADAERARRELGRVRRQFQEAFAARLVCAGFERSNERPRYLLYEEKSAEY